MSEKFIGRRDVQDTPFSIVEFENNKHIIAIANQRISKKEFNSHNEAIDYINSRPWELLLNTTCALLEMYNKTQKKQKK